LSLLVYELGKVAGADLSQVRDSEDEADRVQDVGLAGSIESCDGVEVRVESVEERVLARSKVREELYLSKRRTRRCDGFLPFNHRALRIGLEAVDDDLFDVHVCVCDRSVCALVFDYSNDPTTLMVKLTVKGTKNEGKCRYPNATSDTVALAAPVQPLTL
jgi:hypothetical protein